jgi:hypothetical protein
VLDVLLLLPVARGLLEGLDDEGRGGWDNRDRGLTVLDGKTDGDTESFPVASCLCDIFSDLLGGKTERTNLRSERRRCADLTTGCPKVAMRALAEFVVWDCIVRHCCQIRCAVWEVWICSRLAFGDLHDLDLSGVDLWSW